MIPFIRTVQQAVVGIVTLVVALSVTSSLHTYTQGNILSDIPTLIIDDDDDDHSSSEDRSETNKEEDDRSSSEDRSGTNNHENREEDSESSSSLNESIIQKTLELLNIQSDEQKSSSTSITQTRTTSSSRSSSSKSGTSGTNTETLKIIIPETNGDTEKELLEEQKKLEEEIRKLQEKTIQEVLKAPESSKKTSSSSSIKRDESVHNAASGGEAFVRDVVEPEAVRHLSPVRNDERSGCFTPEGEWTAQRHRCAAKQSDVIQNIVKQNRTVNTDVPTTVRTVIQQVSETPFAEEDSVVVETMTDTHIRNRFSGNIADVQSEKRRELAERMGTLTDRLQAILTYRKVPEETDAFIRRNISWLESAETIVRTKQFSESEIRTAIQSVQQIADNVSVTLKKAEVTPGYEARETQPIESIVSKTDTLLKKVGIAIAILDEEGSPVSDATRDAYNNAMIRFRMAQAACTQNKDRCNDLDDVFALLEKVRGPLINAHAKDPSLETKVEQRLQ